MYEKGHEKRNEERKNDCQRMGRNGETKSKGKRSGRKKKKLTNVETKD